jgi:hypothetical protein
MEPEKISLDVRESTKILRYFQLFFSLVCFVVAVWIFMKLVSTGTMSGSNLIAVAFILLFGIWELTSGLGITQRYIVFSGESITLKHRYFAKPAIYNCSNIKSVVFRPLSFIITCNDGKKTAVKLGNYYQERTLKILESASNFCKTNQIATEGLEQENKQE